MTNVHGGPDPFPREEVQAALGQSALARLPDRLQAQLLAESVRAELPRGRLLEGPPLFLVVSGLIRVALQSPDGRRFAVAYLRRGDIAGLARLTGRRYPLSFETVTDCRLLRLGEPAVQEPAAWGRRPRAAGLPRGGHDRRGLNPKVAPSTVAAGVSGDFDGRTTTLSNASARALHSAASVTSTFTLVEDRAGW